MSVDHGSGLRVVFSKSRYSRGDMSGPFHILFVCTGNICRSPMAQAMLSHRLRELSASASARFVIASAGTEALVGSAMEPHAVDALGKLTIDLTAFEAQAVNEQLIGEADLILTATRKHRAAVVTAVPDVVRRAFTIREFARLADSLGAEALVASDPAALVERVASQRGQSPPVDKSEDDIADPYLQSKKVYAQTAALLQPAIEVIATALVGAAGEHDGERRLPDDLKIERE